MCCRLGRRIRSYHLPRQDVIKVMPHVEIIIFDHKIKRLNSPADDAPVRQVFFGNACDQMREK